MTESPTPVMNEDENADGLVDAVDAGGLVGGTGFEGGRTTGPGDGASVGTGNSASGGARGVGIVPGAPSGVGVGAIVDVATVDEVAAGTEM